ncbi:uncharacterized protein LOC115447731 isoform X2 [Manduca sexta]|uniref:uncharacterized protein LOC115447731 isoform X2 n=1 Tax=Manduca sexta TaxID=7130 RepID=UPI00188DC817|nr:uncharacterized protein LOC115447731 isoform X2 [Manduca sexta]
MCELVMVIILATAVAAFYDETADYWYENGDGIVVDNTEALRNDLFNHTNILREGLYRQLPQAIKYLEMVRDDLRPAEASFCAAKGIMNFGCTQCVCMGGQLFLCTSTVCPPKNQTRRNEHLRFISYRDRIRITRQIQQPLSTPAPYKPKCREGQRVPADDPCNECICLNGKFSCTKRDCDVTHVQFFNCKVGTWYNPRGEADCRYCYCLDPYFSFCFMYLCLSHETTVYPKPEPRCKGNQEFTLGTSSNCKGCTCKNNKWECWEKSVACPNYDDLKCDVPDIFENGNGFCSSCFCGEEENICATDVFCANKLAKKYSKIDMERTRIDIMPYNEGIKVEI